MKLIAYARASTEDQQLTLTDQQEKLRQYALLYDHEIVELVVESESAKSIANRDEFQRVLQLLRDGAADGLLVLKIDRLVRDVADGQHLLKVYFGERAKHRKFLCSVMDYVDTRTATGRMIFNFQLVIAQWEREVIAERTKAALAVKSRAGLRVGEVRYGYRLAADGKSLESDASEQQGISLMRALRDDGWSYQRIAKELDKLGFPTKYGGTWRASTVSRILTRNA